MDLSNDTESGSRNRYALKIVLGLVVVGAALGLFVGLAGATALRSIGIDESNDPPPPAKAAPASPSGSKSPDATPTEDATPEESEPTSEPDKKKPDKKKDEKKSARLNASPDNVSTGQRIDLKGRIPGAGSGTTLQVQRKVGGSDWEDFPVTAETEKQGKFSTWVLTGRSGMTKFRLVVPGTEARTPVAKVAVG